MANESVDNLNGFRAHGVDFSRSAGSQMVGDCPFCGKESHLYVNKETKLWDCKRCGEKGNFEDFLGAVGEGRTQDLTEARLAELAKDRGLPVDAFRSWPFGWDGNRYLLPIQNSKGRTIDIRTYRLGHKLLSTPTASTGLLGARELVVPEKLRARVYICEGEWDAVALNWLLLRSNEEGVVVGVPGAGTFKDAWVPLFAGRDVVVLYDNDDAGKAGELTVLSKLTGTVNRLQFVHWPDNTAQGYDVRDFVKKFAVQTGETKTAWAQLQKFFAGHPRNQKVLPAGGGDQPGRQGGDAPAPVLKPISTNELIAGYSKWLHLSNFDALVVQYGAILANRLGGDPIWLFLVAPPGGMKSELLMSLAKAQGVHALSSLTPHTLISGASWKEGQDPSLLPQLQGKMLIIKDFTTILTMQHTVRDEIFGVLRDVYDGNTEKVFGNGIRRKYQVRFGILAGVTPAIEVFNVMHQSLGERFLKFRIGGNWDQKNEEDKILRALNNIGKEDLMRDDLQRGPNRFMANLPAMDPIPEIPDAFKMRIVHLAKFSARLRGVVERDKYSGAVLYKPSSEVGTRIAKQMAKLGQGIACFLGKPGVDMEVYRLLRRVALDTVPDRVEDVVRGLIDCNGLGGGGTNTQELSGHTRLPQTTVFQLLQDMNLLRLVENIAQKGAASWRISSKIMEHVIEGQIYDMDGGKAQAPTMSQTNGAKPGKMKIKTLRV